MNNIPTVNVDNRLHKLTDSINTLADSIHHNNKEKGFWQGDTNVGEMLMLVVSELGEAIEAHRKDTFTKINEQAKEQMSSSFLKSDFESNIKNTFEDEIADAIIRLLDLSSALQIDIGWHIKQKVAYNTARAYKHGKQY